MLLASCEPETWSLFFLIFCTNGKINKLILKNNELFTNRDFSFLHLVHRHFQFLLSI
jgi:hypothetical protein